MIRFVLRRTGQVGPDTWETDFLTVDDDVAEVERLLRLKKGLAPPWVCMGVELRDDEEPSE